MKPLISDLEKKILEADARRTVLKGELESVSEKLSQAVERLKGAIEARALITDVAQKTQVALSTQIESITSSALNAVFPDPYSVSVEFSQKRNQTNCVISFMKHGEKLTPIEDSGGGALDVASFALRVAFWTLKKTRNTMIFDEPFKNLSVDLQPACSSMLKALSDKLGLQFIMITHQPNLIEAADNILEIKRK